MKIASLSQFTTEMLERCGALGGVVAIGHPVGSDSAAALIPNLGIDSDFGGSEWSEISKGLCDFPIDLTALKAAAPDIIVTDVARPPLSSLQKSVGDPSEGSLEKLLGRSVKVRRFTVNTLEQLYISLEELGALVGAAQIGRDSAHRIKAQLMDWCDNFYPRMRNKRVTVLSSVAPLRLAGRWIPDLIKLASGHPQHHVSGDPDADCSWSEIGAFRPDVILVAPQGYTLSESLKTLRFLERSPNWEELPAVKRGEVVFCDGFSLYHPGAALLSGIAVLISAIAGMESGYITSRDEFYRLRYVELHRHRLT